MIALLRYCNAYISSPFLARQSIFKISRKLNKKRILLYTLNDRSDPVYEKTLLLYHGYKQTEV
jgi:hypothetical protein